MRLAIIWFTVLGAACVVQAQSPRSRDLERSGLGAYQPAGRSPRPGGQGLDARGGRSPATAVSPVLPIPQFGSATPAGFQDAGAAGESRSDGWAGAPTELRGRSSLSPPDDTAAERGGSLGGFGRPEDDARESPYPAFDVGRGGPPNYIPATQNETPLPTSANEPSAGTFGGSERPTAAGTTWPSDSSRTYRNDPINPLSDRQSTAVAADPRGTRPAATPFGNHAQQAVSNSLLVPPESETSPAAQAGAGNQVASDPWGGARRVDGVSTGEQRAPRQEYSLTVLLLFGSIGLNIYLFWITWDTYNRYQDLLGDLRSSRNRRESEMSVA